MIIVCAPFNLIPSVGFLSSLIVLQYARRGELINATHSNLAYLTSHEHNVPCEGIFLSHREAQNSEEGSILCMNCA